MIYASKRKQWMVAGILSLAMAAGFAPALAEERPADGAAPRPVRASTPAPAAAAVKAEEEKPTAELTVSALNLYYYQGRVYSRNSLVIQPAMTVGYGGFSANLWGNLDTNPYPTDPGRTKHASNWTETDFTLAYSGTFGRVNAGVSYAYYGIAGAHDNAADTRDQQEFGVTLKWNALLNPALNVYYAFDNAQRWYFLFGVSHTFGFNPLISLKLSATAGYMASALNAAEMDGARNRIDDRGRVLAEKYNGFLDGVVSAALPVKVTPSVTVTPSVALAFPFGRDAENYMKYNSGTEATMNFADKPSLFLIYGITAGYGF